MFAVLLGEHDQEIGKQVQKTSSIGTEYLHNNTSDIYRNSETITGTHTQLMTLRQPSYLQQGLYSLDQVEQSMRNKAKAI